MASDRARVSYDPTRQWRGVVAQQGRVTLEADDNEAATIAAERDRLVTLDVVGPVGSPDGGYALSAVPAGGGPSGSTPGDLTVGPGILYLGGERLELDAAVTYSAQPDWLDHSTDPLWVAPAVPVSDGPSYELVYLVASEQEVSAVEDPALADVALGGPDTTQRLRLLQRVVRRPSASASCDEAWGALEASLAGAGLQLDPASMMVRSTTGLLVGFDPAPAPPALCQPVATGGYLGAENQMIRVMVNATSGGVPDIVWGFDDASFLYRVEAATLDSVSGNTTVTLATSPPDSYHFPGRDQAVELLRDAVALTATDFVASATGFVTTLASAYDPVKRTVVLSGAPAADFLSGATPQLYLRIWQGTVACPEGQPTPLGDTGLTVTLSSDGGIVHPGDWWRFALRPIQPALVYPARYLTEPQPPDGPRTWACPLGTLTWDGGSANASSCVPPFSTLVGLTEAEGGCCTVDVRPADVNGGASLQALLDSHAHHGPITVCLAPGTYTLSRPLVIGAGLDGITLQGCGDGVVLRAPREALDAFVLGLIVVEDSSSVTIRGLELALPLVPLSVNSDAFGGLPLANHDLLDSFALGLHVAIGISVSSAGDLAVADCKFAFPALRSGNLFAAGIYATGRLEGVEVTGCSFDRLDAPTTVPFYDLAVSNEGKPPYQLTFGYLQLAPTNLAPGAAAGGTDVQAGGTTLPAQCLADAVIERCLFAGLSVPLLVMTQIGDVRLDRNTVRNCYGGLWLVSLASVKDVLIFDALAAGNPAVYADLARIGAAATADRIFVMATAIGRVLPASPPLDRPIVIRWIPFPSEADLGAARQSLANLYGEAATSTPAPSNQPAATPEAVRPVAPGAEADPVTPGGEAVPVAPGAEAVPVAPGAEAERSGISYGPVVLPTALNDVFTNFGTTTQSAGVPVADPGTSVALRVDVADCQVDAVIADSYSGAGLVLIDFRTEASSALVHGSRIRSRFRAGETAYLEGLTAASITGNVVANEVAPQDSEKEICYSLVLRVASPRGGTYARGAAVAVTGNVFIDPTRLPTRAPGVPPAVANWDLFNTVIDFSASVAGV